jgi:hypothetical protein
MAYPVVPRLLAAIRRMALRACPMGMIYGP